jgi:predicted enzyme related to lactoylglutathione lyase
LVREKERNSGERSTISDTVRRNPGFPMQEASVKTMKGDEMVITRFAGRIMMLLGLAAAGPLLWQDVTSRQAYAAATQEVAVGPQYDTTHVYVAPEDYDRFVASLIATFGGTTTPQGVFTVTATPSSTISQLALTHAGTVSAFGFKTPIPYPFGAERTGYLVTDLDVAIRAARAAGADVIVSPFADPIGRDAVIQWPGGVNMQLYWHTTPPSYPPLATIPENRVYISADRVAAFTRSFLTFSHGKIISDDGHAPGVEIGRPSDTYRRIRIQSKFGLLTALVTDGHLPYPYGREMTGYEVGNLAETLAKARMAGASVLTGPYTAGGRDAAIVQFPGGYIAEIHAPSPGSVSGPPAKK